MERDQEPTSAICMPVVDVNDSSDANVLHHYSETDGRGPLETPLIEAVMADWPQMMRLLLAAGAEVDMVGKCGMTALGYAKAMGLKEMITLLEEGGAEDEGVRPRYQDWWRRGRAREMWPSEKGWWNVFRHRLRRRVDDAWMGIWSR